MGAVEGVVTDDELRPVAATVTINGLPIQAATANDGTFRIQAPIGDHELRFEAFGFHPHTEEVSVADDASTQVTVQLVPLSKQLPYRTQFMFEGRYDCAHEVPIWTGDCMILLQSVTGEEDEFTEEAFHFRLPVDAGWDSVVLELVWEAAPNNQLDGMRMYLENANGTDVGHSYKVARVEGAANPLRLVHHRGDYHPRADTYEGSDQPAFIPAEGELAQLRIFPMGKFYDQTKQICSDSGCFLGVGAGVDIDFTVHATVFYQQRADDSYSALPDA